jgi:hypothetical protein
MTRPLALRWLAVAAVAAASGTAGGDQQTTSADDQTAAAPAAADAAPKTALGEPPTFPPPTADNQLPAAGYDAWFTDEAMRVDLYHSGTATEDDYDFDRAVREPLWPGMRQRLLDPTGFGKYRFRVEDAATGTKLFSQGYCTLFGEWQATDEALKLRQHRTFEESVRFPFPKAKVRLMIDRREDRPGPDGRGEFKEIFRIELDPASHLVAGDVRDPGARVIPVRETGDPRERIDILILGDGYTAAEMPKYRRDLERFAAVLFNQEAFARNAGLINVWGLETPSRDSGPDEPRKGIWRDTALGTSFNTFDSERYLTTIHDRDLREIAANAPYDTIYILVNTSRYGGGGIYNQWAIYPSDNEYDDYVFLHEFGHSFAALGDEYFDSATAYDDAFYPAGVEPWEPNITMLLPGKPLKWRDLVAAGTPIPTPDDEAHAAVVGAFEGAGYKAKGLYRPYRDCKMFHKGLVPFCPVCARAFDLVIGLYAE